MPPSRMSTAPVAAKLEADRAAYRRRWRVETVMSVLKRRRGEALTASLDETQRAQAQLRGVAYNLHRLVQFGAPCGALDRARRDQRGRGDPIERSIWSQWAIICCMSGDKRPPCRTVCRIWAQWAIMD